MKDVLDVLDIDKAVIIGNSLGGWMAIKFATAYPERVSKLVLIASSGLAEIRTQFLRDEPNPRQTDENMQTVSSIIDENSIPKEVLDFMKLIVESYNPIDYLPVYEDNRLQRLSMPVLFIDVEKDVINRRQQFRPDCSKLIPSAEIVLENCVMW